MVRWFISLFLLWLHTQHSTRILSSEPKISQTEPPCGLPPGQETTLVVPRRPLCAPFGSVCFFPTPKGDTCVFNFGVDSLLSKKILSTAGLQIMSFCHDFDETP